MNYLPLMQCSLYATRYGWLAPTRIGHENLGLLIFIFSIIVDFYWVFKYLKQPTLNNPLFFGWKLAYRIGGTLELPFWLSNEGHNTNAGFKVPNAIDMLPPWGLCWHGPLLPALPFWSVGQPLRQTGDHGSRVPFWLGAVNAGFSCMLGPSRDAGGGPFGGPNLQALRGMLLHTASFQSRSCGLLEESLPGPAAIFLAFLALLSCWWWGHGGHWILRVGLLPAVFPFPPSFGLQMPFAQNMPLCSSCLL
jgi:hypothetical protein